MVRKWTWNEGRQLNEGRRNTKKEYLTREISIMMHFIHTLREMTVVTKETE